MKFIVPAEGNVIDYGGYLTYLHEIKSQLPDHIYAFAANENYFNLSSASSLHDAWLESLTVHEAASGSRHELRQMEVALCLLGHYHDRRIHLAYSGVQRYLFDSPARPGMPRFEHTAHGDLITHEIRLGENGLFIHELLFERDSTLLVEFSGFSHREELIDTY